MKTKFKILFLMFLALCLPVTSACGNDSGTSSVDESSKPGSEADVSEGSSAVDESEEESSEETSKGPSDEEYFSTFVPTVRFTVTSDVHINTDGKRTDDRFAKLFTDSYAYAESSEVYKGLDGVMIVGDLADRGRKDEMEKFNEMLNAGLKEGTEKLVVMGNHDFYNLGADSEKVYTETTGESPDFHKVINGIHFIGITPSDNGLYFTSEDVAWVKEQIEAAVADDPKKPIFICQHHAVQNTVYGSHAYGNSEFASLFRDYPQIINFSGHTHYPITDPRIIFQKHFTAIGTSTLYYYELGLNGVTNKCVYPIDKTGGYSTSTSNHVDSGEYYIVEVDANGAVLVKGFSIWAEGEIARFYIRTPWDKNSFTYTASRAKTSPKPVFESGLALEADNVTGTSFRIAIPQATVTEGVVESYRADVYKNGSLVKKAYALGDYFYHPIPEKVYANVSGLEEDSEYEVKVYAINAYNLQSEDCLTIKVKTAPPIQSEKAPAPDIFSVQFMDGIALDTVTGMPLIPVGNPQTKEIDGKQVGVFDGSSAFNFNEFGSYYELLTNSFTVEAYFKVEAFGGSYVDVFSNQETGGIGIEILSDGRATMSSFINGGYVFPGGEIKFGEYVHFVAAYDGTTMNVYINGRLAETAEHIGGIGWPTAEGAKYLSVGADSDPLGGAQAGMKGEISIANIYSVPLTPAQAKGAYEAAVEK